MIKIPFKVEDGATSIKQTDFRDAYASITSGTEWIRIKEGIDLTIREFCYPFFGRTFFDSLCNKYLDDTMNSYESELLTLLRGAIAHYSIWRVSPKFNVLMTDIGTSSQSDSKGTTNPASSWAYANFYWNIMKEGDMLFDMALTYLFENKDQFTGFEHTLLKNGDTFFRSMTEFQEQADIGSSFKTFAKLMPFAKLVQQQKIRSVLGTAYHNALMERYQTNMLNEVEKELVQHIQRYIATQSMCNALPTLQCCIADGAVWHVSSTDGMYKKHQAAKTPLLDLYDTIYKQALKTLLTYLKVHADDLESLGFTKNGYEIAKRPKLVGKGILIN